jgi:hypothetical protein
MAVNEHDRLCYFSPLKTEGELGCSERVVSSFSTSSTHRVTQVKSIRVNNSTGSVLVYIINNKCLLRDNIMTGGLVSAMLWYMSQVRNLITSVICHVLFCVQWVKMRGDCSYCLYWLNCWPLLILLEHGGYQSSRHDIVSKQTFIIDNVHQNRA